MSLSYRVTFLCNSCSKLIIHQKVLYDTFFIKKLVKWCKEASLEDIGNQDYILTPGRYVGIEQEEDDGEAFEDKMQRLTSELSQMFEESNELQKEIRKSLGAIGYDI